MLKSSVFINKNKLKIPKFDNKIIVLVSLFICGIIVGVMTYLNSDEQATAFLKEILKNTVEKRDNYDIIRCFSDSLSVFIILPVICVFLGLSAVGLPFIASITALFGFISSVWITFLIESFGVKGFGYIMLIALPAIAVESGVIILISSIAAQMSLTIIYKLYDKPKEKTMTVKQYGKEISKFLLTVIAAALLNSAGYKLFSDMISILG